MAVLKCHWDLDALIWIYGVIWSIPKELDLRVGIAFSRRCFCGDLLDPESLGLGAFRWRGMPSPELKGSIARVVHGFWFPTRKIGGKRQGDKNNFKLSKNNSLPLKMDGWETFILSFFLFRPVFRGELTDCQYFLSNESQNPLSQRQFFEDDSFIFPFLLGRIYSFPRGRLQTMYFRKHFGHQLGKQMVTCAGPMVFWDLFLAGAETEKTSTCQAIANPIQAKLYQPKPTQQHSPN